MNAILKAELALLEQELARFIQRMDLLATPLQEEQDKPPHGKANADGLYTCPICGTERKAAGAHRRWCKRATPEQRELFLLTGSYHFSSKIPAQTLLAMARKGLLAEGKSWYGSWRGTALAVAYLEEHQAAYDIDGVLREPGGKLAKDVLTRPEEATALGDMYSDERSNTTVWDPPDPSLDSSPRFHCVRQNKTLSARTCHEAYVDTHCWVDSVHKKHCNFTGKMGGLHKAAQDTTKKSVCYKCPQGEERRNLLGWGTSTEPARVNNMPVTVTHAGATYGGRRKPIMYLILDILKESYTPGVVFAIYPLPEKVLTLLKSKFSVAQYVTKLVRKGLLLKCGMNRYTLPAHQ